MVALSRDLAGALAAIQERVAAAAASAGRDPATIILVAVTKTQPPARIREAAALGLTHFGENRVQEALAKFAPSDGVPAAAGDAGLLPRAGYVLHLIGTLQRNKARRAAAFFDVVESVDRVELVHDLERHRAAAAPDGPPLPVLIEVNISGEAAKTGAPPAALPAIADALAGAGHLAPRGLMAIAAPGLPEPALRRQFAAVRALRDDLATRYPQWSWPDLSMGMSDDFEAAIREGATHIRLGRALFGERQT